MREGREIELEMESESEREIKSPNIASLTFLKGDEIRIDLRMAIASHSIILSLPSFFQHLSCPISPTD